MVLELDWNRRLANAVAQEEIRHLVHRAAMLTDAQDFATLGALFVPDGVLIRPDGREYTGPVEIASLVPTSFDLTRHLIMTHESEISDLRASATSYCVANQLYRRGPVLVNQTAHLTYHDELALVDGDWMFKRRSVAMAWIEEYETRSSHPGDFSRYGVRE